MMKYLKYFSRSLSVVIVGFFALFIAEGFGPEFGWQDSLSHAVMALVVLAFTILAWKKPAYGGWVFVAVGVLYELSVIRAGWYGGLFLGLVPIITGSAFLFESYKTKK